MWTMFRRTMAQLRSLTTHENNVLITTAVFVGVLAGVGAVVFDEAIRFFSHLFLGADEPTTTNLWRVLLAPALGGLLVGPVVVRFAREAKGHGVPEVIEAVALRGGRIRVRVAAAKTVASALTIGSGGSAGREGPIVQIGAALGSWVGQTFRMSEPRVRLLCACGAAGGIAASFNAPLAGVFFALEVVLQRFTTRGFATVVISAVTSAVIWRTAFGNAPVFDVPLFGLRNPVELLFYVVLGILAAFAASAFVRVLTWTEDRSDALPIPEELRPAIGGLLLGAVGVATAIWVGLPLVFGNGLLGINMALGGEIVWWGLLVLLAGKLVGTSLTLGSGGSGGVFAPSLFMGAMLGGVLGQGANALLPTATAEPVAYTMVGMAAVFAAAGQAPISAILILFEMTNDYLIILPLMLACIVSTSTYAAIQRDSIYLTKIRRRGVDLSEGRERHLLERTPIARAIIEDFTALQLPAEADTVHARMREEGSDELICVDGDGRFVGLLTFERLAEALEQDGTTQLEDLVDDSVLPVIPTESLDEALRKIAPRGLRTLPVIEDLASRTVIGAVTRDSLTAAYWAALATEGRRSEESPP